MKSHIHPHKLFEMILLSLFGVLMYISQVIMQALPNIEIVSLLIILITRKFGVRALYSIYVFVGCEILTYGIGIWNINYLYVWLILWLAVYILRKIDNTIVYALISAIFGILFGSFCSIPYFLIGGFSMGMANIIAGINFDFLHFAGNLILTLLLYRPLTNIMNKLIKR
ncbi:MAG: hypothetical protein E7560_04260 [Ruminococcaceae bacterium]|nr:hypothetical protein [Oscillospiraceae bacterium]